MTNISLSLYTLRLRETHSQEYLPIDNFDEEHDLYQIIGDYMTDRSQNYRNDEDNKHLFRISGLQKPGRSFKGTIETGDYGYETDIVNVDDFTLAYAKQTDDAEMFPFYFYLALPQGANLGILAMQRLGQRGVKTYFSFDLVSYFRHRFSQIMLDIEPLIPAQLIREYLQNGRATKIRFIRFGIHSDISDAVRKNHEPGEGLTEIVIRAKKDRQFPIRGLVEQILAGERDISTLANFRNFEYKTVKVEIEISGVRRTIDLTHPGNLNAELDITNEVKLGDDGLPTFESLDVLAKQYISDALGRVGINNYNVQ